MAFKLSTVDVGKNAPPIEYFHTNALSITLGEALTMTEGELTKCEATVRPDYIAVGGKEDGIVPVIRVQAYQVFETTLQADGALLHAGDKVTLHTDALQVTATTGSGVAIIDHMDGTAVGSPIFVRF